jgi:hypothetical protein
MILSHFRLSMLATEQILRQDQRASSSRAVLAKPQAKHSWDRC